MTEDYWIKKFDDWAKYSGDGIEREVTTTVMKTRVVIKKFYVESIDLHVIAAYQDNRGGLPRLCSKLMEDKESKY